MEKQKEILNQFNQGLVNSILEVIEKKFPGASETLKEYYFASGGKVDRSTHYQSDGNTFSHFTANWEGEFTTYAPTSSHPDLKRSKTRFQLFIRYRIDQPYSIRINMPIDSVDVAYCSLPDKVCRKNVTLGRAWNRRVGSWLYGAFKKKVPASLEIPKEVAEAIKVVLDPEQYRLEREANKAKRLAAEKAKIDKAEARRQKRWAKLSVEK
jgi:hypothetical protein